MTDRDTAEFGAIVDRVVGCTCERSLATNSIKLRFNTDDDARGRQYIWIDPPWELHEGGRVVTTSADYDDEKFRQWSELFHPLDRVRFIGWERGEADDRVVFRFENGFSLVVPCDDEPSMEDSWYVHWYAAEPERSA